jgi:hypothetical protein
VARIRFFRPEGPAQLSALGNAQGKAIQNDFALKGQRSYNSGKLKA